MLEVKNVSKLYGENSVFNKVSFEASPQSIIALTGKNGSGKTTLLNILGGIITYSGNISIEDINQCTQYEDYMKLISYVPNIPYLYDYLTFDETIQILSTGSMHLERNINLSEELIRGFNLTEYRNTLCKNLSLGTRQKLAFIIAFFDYPKVILLDEPFVNFDNSSVIYAINFMKEYIETNKAIIIYSTHTHSNSDLIKKVTNYELEIVNEDKIIIHEK